MLMPCFKIVSNCSILVILIVFIVDLPKSVERNTAWQVSVALYLFAAEFLVPRRDEMNRTDENMTHSVLDAEKPLYFEFGVRSH